jgi:hypothetical protein
MIISIRIIAPRTTDDGALITSRPDVYTDTKKIAAKQHLKFMRYKKKDELDTKLNRRKQLKRGRIFEMSSNKLGRRISQLVDNVKILEWTIKLYDICHKKGKTNEEKWIIMGGEPK